MHLIDEFVRLSENLPVCALFRKWTAIFAIAVATRRRVWMISPGFDADLPLYPNFYILLVARPGIGKTLAAKRVEKLLRHRGELRFTPHDITGPALLKNMADPTRRDPPEIIDGQMVQVTHRAAILSEWANFLPHDDFDMMATLSTLWDSEKTHEKETVMRGGETIENVFLNILGGVQPAWFAEQMPRGAWGQGLFARVILVQSDEKIEEDEDADIPDPSRWDPWLAEVEKVMHLKGRMHLSADAKAEMKKWRLSGYDPAPVHALLEGYNGRRKMQVWKLAMVSALASRRELVVRGSDVLWGIATLAEAEKTMPAALAFAGNNPYRMYEEMCIDAVLTAWNAKPSRPTTESVVRGVLMRNLPAQYIDATLDNLIAAGRLGVHMGEKPNRQLKPGPNARMK